MSVSRTGANSAAYLLLVLAMTFLIGGILITVLDPYVTGLFDSQLFALDTSWGQDLSTWYQELWGVVGFLVLVAILVSAFINSRRPV